MLEIKRTYGLKSWIDCEECLFCWIAFPKSPIPCRMCTCTACVSPCFSKKLMDMKTSDQFWNDGTVVDSFSRTVWGLTLDPPQDAHESQRGGLEKGNPSEIPVMPEAIHGRFHQQIGSDNPECLWTGDLLGRLRRWIYTAWKLTWCWKITIFNREIHLQMAECSLSC